MKVILNEKVVYTPAGYPLEVPTEALAVAIQKEWEGKLRFNAATMPFTAFSYTAIDRAQHNQDVMVEVLLAYVDTDTLCYRSDQTELLKEQKEAWDPWLAWAGNRFSALWQTTSGLMPLEQSPALHEAIVRSLKELDPFQLMAAGVVASLCSSLILSFAVVERQLSAEKALALSILEETYQAKKWGEDTEANQRRNNQKSDILAIAGFLRLIESR